MPKPQVEANAFLFALKLLTTNRHTNYSIGIEVELVITLDPPADLSATALKAKDQSILSDGFFCD